MGMRIGPGTVIKKVEVLWPNQVRIGRDCSVLDGTIFDYCHGVWRPGPSIVLGDRCYVGRGVEFNIRLKLTMGSDCLIAAGCRFIDHDHGTVISQGPMRLQNGASGEIILEDDVWLGANVIVLKGVTIGKGAVVAAASVVTKSIPSMEIWAGVPAKQIGTRR